MQIENSPLISIITPVYNVETYLPQCIESIINQTFKRWELLLIDDGSTDKSGTICDEYSQKDSRIQVLHKENSGQADSRNLALQIAKSPLIGFVDSDDWIDPTMYDILYNAMLQNHADIAMCGYYHDFIDKSIKMADTGTTTVYNSQEALSLIIDDKKIKSFLWNKLYRREVIQELPAKYFFYEDYSTLFKWFTHAEKIAFTEVSLYHYRIRKSSTDNVRDPQKKYHFFLAELERYNYLQEHHLLIERKEELVLKLVKTGLIQCKQISRFAINVQQAKKYIEDIRNRLEPYLPLSYKLLGFQKYRKIWEICHVPRWYINWTRFRGLFSNRKRHKKRNNYFE